MPMSKLPVEHYRAGNVDANKVALPDGSEVKVERYEQKRRVHILWPTPLGPGPFFDRATEAIGLKYNDVIDDITDHYLPESDVGIVRLASLPLPDDIGELGWQIDPLTSRYEGAFITRRIGGVAIRDLMYKTGSFAVVDNIGALAVQVDELLSAMAS